MKRNFCLLFSLFTLYLFPSFLFSQSPQSIPYQAMVRNTDGSVMSSTAMTMTFKIHDVTAAGTIVYQESHSTTSNAQGLVVLQVGQGQASVGTFDNINWGNGAKFLHVLMNVGNGEVDLGTQQMMSVPYALYTKRVRMRTSATGDTLIIGGNSVIVPGISAANPTAEVGQMYQGGVVVYEFQSGDFGYVAGENHGIIASMQDLAEAIFGCYNISMNAANSAVGSGAQNTENIVNGCTQETTAALLCWNLVLNGYSDWFLPSMDELGILYQNRVLLQMYNSNYWSSTELSIFDGGIYNFVTGNPGSSSRQLFVNGVRPIRYY
jgi:hypothetical protein